MGVQGESQRVDQEGPQRLNGTVTRNGIGAVTRMIPSLPREVLLAAAPVLAATVAAAVLMGRRREPSARPTGAGKVARHKPRNIMRYYSIGLLISLLERDTTRKALIAGLKWARQRA